MSTQLSTFYVADRLYGMEVMKVQEITKPLPMTKVPLAPNHVHGLINLRGQIATAIGLRELFGIDVGETSEKMNVICRVDGLLLALLVDKIGEVIEVGDDEYESPPNTIPGNIRRFMDGVYKVPGSLLSVIDIEKISNVILKKEV